MIELDARALTDAIMKLEAACDELQQEAGQLEREALGSLIVQSEVNIYRTTPGKYVRTGHFRQGLEARATASRNMLTVTVSNSVDYAAAVEAGRQGMSLAMLQQMALLQADNNAPLTLGRSGANWQAAAPVVTAAQAFAYRRMQELFSQKVQAALR